MTYTPRERSLPPRCLRCFQTLEVGTVATITRSTVSHIYIASLTCTSDVSRTKDSPPTCNDRHDMGRCARRGAEPRWCLLACETLSWRAAHKSHHPSERHGNVARARHAMLTNANQELMGVTLPFWCCIRLGFCFRRCLSLCCRTSCDDGHELVVRKTPRTLHQTDAFTLRVAKITSHLVFLRG